uniref:MT0828m n=1 Tax=Chlamydomonas reinhardtii TaxID=3055 RepID=D5LB19_CHLRE|nr:MT0828m [Chlamydomonas reinhardtii]
MSPCQDVHLTTSPRRHDAPLRRYELDDEDFHHEGAAAGAAAGGGAPADAAGDVPPAPLDVAGLQMRGVAPQHQALPAVAPAPRGWRHVGRVVGAWLVWSLPWLAAAALGGGVQCVGDD